MRSDRLLEVDWRLTELERSRVRFSVEDREWMRAVMRSWLVWSADDGPQWEFVWRSVGARARRLLVRSWHPSR